MPKKAKSSKNGLGKRNPLALNPLMKKSHVHTNNSKTERSNNKQALKKALRDGDGADQ